jgi:predicted ATPase
MMRLQSLYISNYKNLKNFKLEFDGQSFIDVFVGKNGTGKSNLFEALIEIFQHLFEFDKGDNELNFDYTLKYEIENNQTEISWLSGKLVIQGKERKTIGKTPMPDNLLIYYSGHNATVARLVQTYEDAFRKRIKVADIKDSRSFIGIGPEYKELLLAILLMQSKRSKAKRFICQKLGIKTVAPLVKLILQRPVYAKGRSAYDIMNNDEADRYWRPEGITQTFLNRLSRCIDKDLGSPIRTEGYFSSGDEYDQGDYYILYFHIEKIQKEFIDLSAQELFRQFDNLKTLGMLREISIAIELDNGTDATTDYFSDGQFQSVYIYSIVELFKDRNCLTLLDEPDCFLHPEWQFEFLKQVFEITNNAAKNNHVLMSSHSAVTLIPHDNKKIKFFDIKKNSAYCYDLPKQIAINKLSSDLIKYSEREPLLSIINKIQIEKKPVLLTEGITDQIILNEAWHKLYEKEMPFVPLCTLGCTYLSQLLKADSIMEEMNGQPLFGIFDFDEAYNQWNGIDGESIEKNPYKGLIKKCIGKEVYAIMLPVPNNKIIKKQVIKKEKPLETFCHNSHCEMEHIFYGSEKTPQYFQEEPHPGGPIVVFKSDANKTDFARIVIPTIEREYFEIFRPIFEFIKSKC